MSLIRNERIKLAANALNTLSTASVTIGVFAPEAAFLYGLGRPDPVPALLVVLASGAWLTVGVYFQRRSFYEDRDARISILAGSLLRGRIR